MADSVDSRDATAPGRGRATVVTLLVLAALLLLPLVIGLGVAAENAAHHRSGTDWRGNHQRKVAVQQAAALLFLVPLGGALLGRGCAAALRRRRGAGTAWGLFLAVVGLWAALAVELYLALRHATFVF